MTIKENNMNEQSETLEQTVNQPVTGNDVPASAQSREVRTSKEITPQAGGGSCGCGGTTGLTPNGTRMVSADPSRRSVQA